jgi:hypothetical protein
VTDGVACVVETKAAAVVAWIVEIKTAAAACIAETTAADAVAWIVVEVKFAAAAAAAAPVGIVELEFGIAVVVEAGETVDVVSRVELKPGAAGAAGGIGAAKTATVAGKVRLETAAGWIETTKAAAVARVLLDILRPRAGTGNTGLEQSATDCVAQRVVAGVIGEFGFVAIRGAELDLQLENNQADIRDPDLGMKGFEPDPGHRCTVEY